MFEFLFGRKDTADSLVAEVFATLNKYRDLQSRLSKLAGEISTALSLESSRHDDELMVLKSVYDEDVEAENEVYETTVDDYTETLTTLGRGRKVADKIVSFFEDE